MKQEFSARPAAISEQYCKDCYCSWQGFVTGMPSLVFVVTGWKKNGNENACLQSWASFLNDGPDGFVCVMPANKGGHMYKSLKRTRACVLNFPSNGVYGRCVKTIGNNQWEADEITAAGLTAEPASKVNAPRIKECFLNIECKFLWEHKGLVAVKAVNICMDSGHYDQSRLGRYGKTGYLYQIDQATNPETGEIAPFGPGIIEQGDPVPWETK
ncbi:MAG: flavin reductase [Firmicutes bacterium]|nr:flavin reductase [Bacillota bacterium]